MEIGDVEKAYQRWLRKQMGYWASSLRIIKVSCEHRRDADKENRVSEGTGSTRVAERFVVLSSPPPPLRDSEPKTRWHL